MFFNDQKVLWIRFALIIVMLGTIFAVHPVHAESIGYGWAQSLGGRCLIMRVRLP
jgi:hypothetical protein